MDVIFFTVVLNLLLLMLLGKGAYFNLFVLVSVDVHALCLYLRSALALLPQSDFLMFSFI